MRVTKHPEERRSELVCAARQLFDEKGIEHTRVSDIVGRVGVAQGVFYYYFRSKDEMVQEVLRLVNEEMDARANTILQDHAMDCSAKIAAFIELYIDVVDQVLADDATSLQPLVVENGAFATVVQQSLELLATRWRALVEQEAQKGHIAVDAAGDTADVLLYGLRCLAAEHLPKRAFIYAVIERCLGMAPGQLTARLPAAARAL